MQKMKETERSHNRSDSLSLVTLDFHFRNLPNSLNCLADCHSSSGERLLIQHYLNDYLIKCQIQALTCLRGQEQATLAAMVVTDARTIQALREGTAVIQTTSYGKRPFQKLSRIMCSTSKLAATPTPSSDQSLLLLSI